MHTERTRIWKNCFRIFVEIKKAVTELSAISGSCGKWKHTKHISAFSAAFVSRFPSPLNSEPIFSLPLIHAQIFFFLVSSMALASWILLFPICILRGWNGSFKGCFQTFRHAGIKIWQLLIALILPFFLSMESAHLKYGTATATSSSQLLWSILQYIAVTLTLNACRFLILSLLYSWNICICKPTIRRAETIHA